MRMKGITLIRISDGQQIHTYSDWGLILKSRPEIAPPSPKTEYVDLPGTNGSLDLTESLTGEVVYETREINMVFNVIQDKEEWPEVYSSILDYLHGRNMKIIMDDDPDYYYVGRVTVDDWKSNPNRSELTMSAIAEPYKMERSSSMEDWEWDPFNLETGVIREYKEMMVDGSMTLAVTGSRKPVVPSFIVKSQDGSGMTLKFDGAEYHLADGTSHVVNIRIKEGSYNFTFEGTGMVSVDYRGGRL